MWYGDERVVAKPYDDGGLAGICTTNRVENEQDWKGVQFVSTAAVLVICNLFLIYIWKMNYVLPFGEGARAVIASSAYLRHPDFAFFNNRYDKNTSRFGL